MGASGQTAQAEPSFVWASEVFFVKGRGEDGLGGFGRLYDILGFALRISLC